MRTSIAPLGQPIYLIGVEFSKDERNVAAFDVEQA